jgi:hypothetical protein
MSENKRNGVSKGVWFSHLDPMDQLLKDYVKDKGNFTNYVKTLIMLDMQHDILEGHLTETSRLFRSNLSKVMTTSVIPEPSVPAPEVLNTEPVKQDIPVSPPVKLPVQEKVKEPVVQEIEEEDEFNVDLDMLGDFVRK